MRIAVFLEVEECTAHMHEQSAQFAFAFHTQFREVRAEICKRSFAAKRDVLALDMQKFQREHVLRCLDFKTAERVIEHDVVVFRL